ncbi:hypothetical protein C2869_06325 [Saccharobesus litoralis]|uniref:Lipoprotein n=1 Tax=Saccharobesus litoralis TaxID=2172099 RepID=A0A2S0VPF4_9ALTE|nr:hypothetical protein [Saccharobesus litoralis]AWB66079.1 hypothetical protein C2869_06325 [Saccharobesus litoralis]
MKILAAVLVLITLNGCTVVPATVAGLDSLIPRESKPIPGHFLISYQDLRTSETTHIKISCEHYYRAGFSTQGNAWSLRYVQEPQKFQFTLPDGQQGEFDNPSCFQLLEPEHYKFNNIRFNLAAQKYIWFSKESDKWVYRKYNRTLKKPEVIFEVPIKIELQKVED